MEVHKRAVYICLSSLSTNVELYKINTLEINKLIIIHVFFLPYFWDVYFSMKGADINLRLKGNVDAEK